jgi:dinuclear metal center YbgI/SA1388 family protein
LEEAFPPSTAEDWDAVGLQVGDLEGAVERLLVALDPTEEAVIAAAGQHASMLITHHPLWLHPLASIRPQDPVGRVVWTAIRRGVALFCAHTNLDRAEGGPNDLLAQRLGLLQVEPLRDGMGRLGSLRSPVSFQDFCLSVQANFPDVPLRMAGVCPGDVERVAVCCGSGASFLDEAHGRGAQLLVTGDVKYHDARRAEALGMALLDMGHFASERIIVPWLCERINGESQRRGWGVQAVTYDAERDPFRAPTPRS